MQQAAGKRSLEDRAIAVRMSERRGDQSMRKIRKEKR
jgi:hypothetical protein